MKWCFLVGCISWLWHFFLIFKPVVFLYLWSGIDTLFFQYMRVKKKTSKVREKKVCLLSQKTFRNPKDIMIKTTLNQKKICRNKVQKNFWVVYLFFFTLTFFCPVFMLIYCIFKLPELYFFIYSTTPQKAIMDRLRC